MHLPSFWPKSSSLHCVPSELKSPCCSSSREKTFLGLASTLGDGLAQRVPVLLQTGLIVAFEGWNHKGWRNLGETTMLKGLTPLPSCKVADITCVKAFSSWIVSLAVLKDYVFEGSTSRRMLTICALIFLSSSPCLGRKVLWCFLSSFPQ